MGQRLGASGAIARSKLSLDVDEQHRFEYPQDVFAEGTANADVARFASAAADECGRD